MPIIQISSALCSEVTKGVVRSPLFVGCHSANHSPSWQDGKSSLTQGEICTPYSMIQSSFNSWMLLPLLVIMGCLSLLSSALLHAQASSAATMQTTQPADPQLKP